METSLTNDMITQPELWRCALLADRHALHVALVPPVQGENMISRSLTLNAEASTPLKALEDTVYDNPLLLSDFSRIDCAVGGSHHIVVPTPGMPDDDTLEALFEKICGAEEESRTIASAEIGGGATLVYSIPTALESFLQRTFFGINIVHPLAVTGAETVKASEGADGPVMTVVADDPGRVTVAAASEGQLLMLNSFSYNHPADAAYYVMASRIALGLGNNSGVIRLAGIHHYLEAIAGTLRQYCTRVDRLPLPPSLCRYGREATRLPFPLTLILS